MALVNPLSNMIVPSIQSQEAPTMQESLMTDQDVSRVMSAVSPRQGLLSRIGGGLLGAGQSVGSGLLGAGRAAVAGIDPEQLSRDIIDTRRFYQQAMMSQPSMVLGRDLAKLQNITPQGIAASLPALRAQEQEALQGPELQRLKTLADLERAKGTGSLAAQKTAPKTYLLPDGQTVVETYFDKISGQRLMSGTNEPIPAGSLELAAGDVPNFENLSDFNEKVTEEEQKLIALDKYKNALKEAPEGLGRTIQAMNMILQTLSSDPTFKKGDLATGEARARLQGLIGTYKDDIVGGGVMTEQDALRVIEALGGEVSAFNPSELQIKLIDSFRENTKRKYDSALERFNSAYRSTLPTMAGKRIFGGERAAYVNPYDEGGLTPELRELYGL